MGELREMEKWINAKELAKRDGVTVRAINERWKAVFPETTFDSNAKLSPEKVLALREAGKQKPAKRGAKKSFNPRPSFSPPAPEKPETAPARSFFDNWEFDLINLIEMGLISWGLWLAYNVSGLFLAAMCCLFIYKTQQLVKRPKMESSSERSLEVVWWVCFASCGLHSITFYNSIEMTHSGGTDPLLYVHLTAAFVPALFVSVFSYKAVATTRVITTEQ